VDVFCAAAKAVGEITNPTCRNRPILAGEITRRTGSFRVQQQKFKPCLQSSRFPSLKINSWRFSGINDEEFNMTQKSPNTVVYWHKLCSTS
jgi:hypothetical protein